MPDFDIECTGLAVPPVSAPVSNYRPAVLAKNNGLKTVNVSGVMRIYDRATGALLHTKNLSVLGVPPGQTKHALADSYWQPTNADIGREYLFTADIIGTYDQIEVNNHLAPVTVLVVAGEAPPPPILTAHATQHETGGPDQVDVTGLQGVLADPQTPTGHHTEHEPGGSDPIASTTAQVHHLTHEDGGTDPINVTDMPGVLFNLQKPKEHGNAAHEPNMAHEADLISHIVATGAHEAATNLEQTVRKGAANGYPSLDADTQVPIGQLIPVVLTGPGEYFHIFTQPGAVRDLALTATLEHTTNKGTASGYAELDAAALVPSAQLAPSPSANKFLRASQEWVLLPADFSATNGGVLVHGDDPETALIETVIPLEALAGDTQVEIGSALGCLGGGLDNVYTFRLYVDNVLKASIAYTNAVALIWTGRVTGLMIGVGTNIYKTDLLMVAANSDGTSVIRHAVNINTSTIPAPGSTIKLTLELTGQPGDAIKSEFAWCNLPGGLR